MNDAPSIDDIAALRHSLGSTIHRTPLLRCASLEDALGDGSVIYSKLEFLQRTGTFKARSALAIVNSLSAKQRKIGVTAVSAGNHAIATAFAAQVVGASAKVVMISSANPARIDACRAFAGEVVLVDNVHEAFEVAERIQREEGRFFVHPFEGREVATGTGTIGLEIHEQCEDFDAVVVSIGGGGLIGGIANAIKQLRPGCEVIGVEPDGADSMHRSFAAGKPRTFMRRSRLPSGSSGRKVDFSYIRSKAAKLRRVRARLDSKSMSNVRTSTQWLSRLAVEDLLAASQTPSSSSGLVAK